MHRFLKILILIIVLWTITLPWTLSYLSTLTALPGGNDIGRITNQSKRHFQSKKYAEEKVVVGVVACGEKALNKTIVLLKSILLSSLHHGLLNLDAILFADDDHLYTLDLKVGDLKNRTKGLNFRYEIHPVIFPAKNHDEWKSLFRPCASQRLFFHTALPHIDKILYLDVDTLVVGNIKKVWENFRKMSSEQAVGLVAEHEVSSMGWYNRFARHPFYPPLGVNTGVMLMNLTKLRYDLQLQWESAILSAYKKYKDKIVFGDQDLINIILYHKPDAVYLLPCSFNYRSDHCENGWNCKSAEADRSRGSWNGIQILHGNRNVFLDGKLRMFKKVFKYFEQFDMAKDNFLKDLVMPFQKEVNESKVPSHANETRNCDSIGRLLF